MKSGAGVPVFFFEANAEANAVDPMLQQMLLQRYRVEESIAGRAAKRITMDTVF